MHLIPREVDKLLLHNAGFVAQKRLARGLRLGYTESVALIAAQLLEFIRENRTVAELMDMGRRFLGRRQVIPGVPGDTGRARDDLRRAGGGNFCGRLQVGDGPSSDFFGEW
jgi:urease gamma subunit